MLPTIYVYIYINSFILQHKVLFHSTIKRNTVYAYVFITFLADVLLVKIRNRNSTMNSRAM